MISKIQSSLAFFFAQEIHLSLYRDKKTINL